MTLLYKLVSFKNRFKIVAVTVLKLFYVTKQEIRIINDTLISFFPNRFNKLIGVTISLF